MRREKLEELNSYIREFQTIKREKVENGCCFITAEGYDFTLANGEVIRREKVLKNGKNGGAAIIFPLTVDNNVLLIVEPRVFTREGVGVSFPAGYIEEGESPEMAAKRELLEETGYVSTEMDELLSFYQDEGCIEAMNYAFIASGCKRMGKQKLDKGEFVRYFECSLDEAMELIELGYIKGANALLTMERAKTYVKERSRNV